MTKRKSRGPETDKLRRHAQTPAPKNEILLPKGGHIETVAEVTPPWHRENAKCKKKKMDVIVSETQVSHKNILYCYRSRL